MRTCLTCGEVYSDDVEVCEVDGTALSGWGEGVAEARSRATLQLRKSSEAIKRPSSKRGDSTAEAEVEEASEEEREEDWEAHVPAPGRVLGERYALERQLGVGGFGAVFAAEDLRLQKKVAVKILSPQVTHQEEMLERFRREAIAASQVGHEGIVDVTDFDRDEDGTPFIVMELLDGKDLAEVLARERPLPIKRSLEIAAQAAFALDAAHHKQILHRDLKPANIYLVNTETRYDFVKIIDFGISKIMTPSVKASTLTSKGLVLGTPHFMAPEQARGDSDIDGRVDVYSLGIILYAMIAGRPPFLGDTYLGVVSQHLSDEPAPPSTHRADIASVSGLDALVLRAIAKKPRDRFASMRELGDHILEILTRLDPAAATAIRPVRVRSSRLHSTADGIAAAPTVASDSVVAGSKKRRLWPLIAGLGVLGLVAVFWVAGGSSSKKKKDSTPAAVVVPDAGVAVAEAPADAAPAPPILLKSAAPGAEAFNRGGELLGKLPLSIARPTSRDGRSIVIRAAGYDELAVRLRSNTTSPFEVTLTPTAAAQPDKKAKRHKKKKPKKRKRWKRRDKGGGSDIVDEW
jgi:serine/threonine-protein kinase